MGGETVGGEGECRTLAQAELKVGVDLEAGRERSGDQQAGVDVPGDRQGRKHQDGGPQARQFLLYGDGGDGEGHLLGTTRWLITA